MAFDGAMKAMGSAKPKMAPKMSGEKSKPEPKGKVEGEAPDQGEHAGNTTTIEHHPDGSHTMDGETHPSHLHVMAALGHKLTGDKHHVAHHDGMAVHSHGVTEMGEHQEGTHGSAEEAGQHLTQFMGDGDEQQQEEPQHAMGGYGG